MKKEEMLEGDEDYEDSDSYSCLDQPMPGKGKGKGKGKRERKRRFSDDQIRSLESMFESQTKVEPRKKMQLAKELGLQPRQVSIWFQNKRARWKSKQLETEFGALKADYDALLSNFESLKKEKHSLLKQLQKLADLLEKGPPDLGNNNSDSGTSGASNEERELNRALTEGLGFLRPNKVQTDEEQTRISCYLEKQEEPLDHHHNHHPLPYMIDPTTDGCCFDDAGCFSDQSCNTSQWWEVWPLNE